MVHFMLYRFSKWKFAFLSGTRTIVVAVPIFTGSPDGSGSKACSKSLIVAHPAYFVCSPRIAPSVPASVFLLSAALVFPLFAASVFASVFPLLAASVFASVFLLSVALVFPIVTASVAAPAAALIFPSASSAHTAITIPITIPSTHI